MRLVVPSREDAPMGQERLDVDPELEIVAELDDVIQRLQSIKEFHLKRIASQVVPTHSTGLPCIAEIVWTGEDDEVRTHEVAPPPDGFGTRDEPPSRPVDP